MLSVCEEKEVFFDSVDQLKEEGDNWMYRNLDYDIWLSEPQSVNKRKEVFLSRMGFVQSEIETSTESRATSIIVDDDDALLSERWKSNSEAEPSGDYCHQDLLDDIISEDLEPTNLVNREKKKMMSWWGRFTRKMKKNQTANLSKESNLHSQVGTLCPMRIEQNRKKYMECTAVYTGQELKAHNGVIWTMKFSPDGQYLASAGADGVVGIWRVADKKKHGYGRLMDIEGKQKKKTQVCVVVPEKVFHIVEEPLHKFRAHTSDVLDLAWSTTNHLLSSSMDKTVCLWQAGCDECLGVFHHSNYVTCVQFNPVDESYFISGSIDGKVRIWGIARRRVKDWANVRDIVTTICYQPDGKGFVVGSVSGHCRFYQILGDELLLNADINIQGKRKSSGNRITGIQFLKNDSQRVMITSEDSKICILDGLEIVRKYKGLTKSACQMSALFTSSGSYIVSVGGDSRVYLWNYEDPSNIQTSKQAAKSTRSCESFFVDGVSVVIPWSDLDMGNALRNSRSDQNDDASSRIWDSERVALANWFSMDHGSSRASTTWPEEKLPVWDFPSAEHECRPCNNAAARGDLQQHKNESGRSRMVSTTWGLVFVTAKDACDKWKRTHLLPKIESDDSIFGRRCVLFHLSQASNWDGTIRTFHNYGLPIRI